MQCKQPVKGGEAETFCLRARAILLLASLGCAGFLINGLYVYY